jgi:predicted transposase/invertase (TIGR01784 family)
LHKFELYDKNKKIEFDDIMQIYTLEIKKIPKENDGSRIWQWLKLIGSNKKEMETVAENDVIFKKVVDELFKMNANDNQRVEFEEREKSLTDIEAMIETGHEEGKAEGEQIGHTRGVAEGEHAGKVEDARKMLHMGIGTIEQISAVTGLPIEEIEKLNVD